MRKLGGCFTLIVFLAVAYFLVQQWRATSPLGIGTGSIAGGGSGKKQPARSTLVQIVENPTRFTNRKLTVTGRVRGAGRLASNRNIYRLIEGDYKLLVIDDKAPPKDYALRTVSGQVKLIKPPIGNTSYAYLVSVKEGVKFPEPSWKEASGWFTGKYFDAKNAVKETVKNW